MSKINVFWFRRDLRLEDNTGLFHALNAGLPVLPIFIFDKNILDKLEDRRDSRLTFIYTHVKEIHSKLGSQKKGILTFHDTPDNVLEQLSSQFEIDTVYTNRDYEPYATERDSKVAHLLSNKDIRFSSYKDQVIFEKGEILNQSTEPYKVFTPYKNKWISLFRTTKLSNFPSERKLGSLIEMDFPPVVSLESMGFEYSNVEVPAMHFNEAILTRYAETRDFPAKSGTSRLGVHFRFGTVSIRKAIRAASTTSDVWLNELIWREFYMMILAHFPHVVDRAFKPKYDLIHWVNDPIHFQKWCEGKTGYPIVDAGMRELNATGYMHNRVRMIVASFLTKHLLIDWRWGEAYFASKLLDYELASNNGGWQWAAGTGTDAQPYFRVFNPESQQQKFDPKFEYIRKWVVEFGTAEYPSPIVPHKEARLRAINTYKEAIS